MQPKRILVTEFDELDWDELYKQEDVLLKIDIQHNPNSYMQLTN